MGQLLFSKPTLAPAPLMPAAMGGFALNGQNVSFAQTSPSSTLTAAEGSFALTGNAAALSSSTSGLQINLVPTASWLTAPSDYQTKMQTAANILMAAFPGTNCTINIQLEYATFDGGSLANRNSASLDVTPVSTQTFTTIKSVLAAISNPTPELTSMITNLPSGSTLGGQANFFVSFGVCKAIGLFGSGGPTNATDPGLDGLVGMGTGWTSAETIGVSIHELTQAMGRIVQRGTFCFSRFKSAGVWDSSGSFTTAYFSLDGGTTNLATYDGTSDFADFVNGTTDPTSGLWDNFDASQNGSLQDLSPLGKKMMRAMGFR